MKLCINCKHFRFDPLLVYRPDLGACARVDAISLVTGKEKSIHQLTFCAVERKDYADLDNCGTAGKYFESKDSVLTNIEGV